MSLLRQTWIWKTKLNVGCVVLYFTTISVTAGCWGPDFFWERKISSGHATNIIKLMKM